MAEYALMYQMCFNILNALNVRNMPTDALLACLILFKRNSRNVTFVRAGADSLSKQYVRENEKLIH